MSSSLQSLSSLSCPAPASALALQWGGLGSGQEGGGGQEGQDQEAGAQHGGESQETAGEGPERGRQAGQNQIIR